MVESLPLGGQEKGRNILLPENAYDLSGSVQAVYVENHAEECLELYVDLHDYRKYCVNS